METGVSHRQIELAGIELHVAECGQGPLVVCCHGFPELWYSWRHQLPVLAAAGYRVVAPDMRGYGRSGRPEAIGDYDIAHLGADVLGLIDALGEERAVVVGHDWGAMVAWYLAQAAPERLHGVAALSVPFVPRGPRPPTETWRKQFEDQFFYILYFQEPGVADAQLDADPGASLRFIFRRVSPDVFDGTAEVPNVPGWLSDEDFAVYEAEFRRTGFTGGLNWYRNLDRNWGLTEEVAGRKVEIPVAYIGGERDPVLRFMPVEPMAEWVPGLVEQVLIPGVGHWTQQQGPAETNDILVRFLAGLDLPR
ncbi:MAG: alpha/beta fold hydrolase [Acidimicrobiia bacterium]